MTILSFLGKYPNFAHFIIEEGKEYLNVVVTVADLELCRLHTAILDRPPSSAATMEVQGPDTK
jgi:hypothetical protein